MSHHTERLLLEQVRQDHLAPPQIDRDRILYARALARLAEVTQVVSADRGYVFHNRLTHSLKVAQVARRLAEKLAATLPVEAQNLDGPDPEVAEAAALAHDLGHPPFGHIAEKELDACVRAVGLSDGFEGNAQSFRIVTKLAIGDVLLEGDIGPVRGLNLTRSTLNALLKYPWLHGGNPSKWNKWGAYETEREQFQWTRQLHSLNDLARSVEAELMDWADDITYAVHDVGDFFCAGQIPLDRLADDQDEERELFFEEVFRREPGLAAKRTTLEQAFLGSLALFPLDRRFVGTHAQLCALWRFQSTLISRYVGAIQLTIPSSAGPRKVRIESYAEDEIAMLKQLTWHYVILRNDLAAAQHGQRQMIRHVFSTLHESSQGAGPGRLFPAAYQDDLSEVRGDADLTTRLVTDYVAGMTENELRRMYATLTGHPA